MIQKVVDQALFKTLFSSIRHSRVKSHLILNNNLPGIIKKIALAKRLMVACQKGLLISCYLQKRMMERFQQKGRCLFKESYFPIS